MSLFRVFWERWGVTVDEATQLSPEEVAEHLHEFLVERFAPGTQDQVGSYTFTNESAIALVTSTDGATTRRLSLLLAEGWNWLERQGFLIPLPGDHTRNHVFVSSWARAYPTRASVREYRTRLHLRADQLRPALAAEVIPQFLHTNYRAAIQGAFALTERRLRELLLEEGSIPADDLERQTGVDLVNRAFGKNGVFRTDIREEEAEGLHKLLLGAFGLWRNDSSHWRTEHWPPNDAISIVLLANYLLGVLEERGHALRAKRSNDGS